jgi:hypothetical protein
MAAHNDLDQMSKAERRVLRKNVFDRFGRGGAARGKKR